MRKRDKNKVKRVSKEYVNNGFNMSQALKKVEDEEYINKEGYLTVKAHRWRISPEVVEEVKRELEKFDKSVINESFVYANLYKIVNDNVGKVSDRVNALGLIAKCISMFKDSSQNVTVINPSLNNVQLKDRLEAIYHKHIQDKGLGKGIGNE